jgi:hypothetical protein
LRRDSAGCLHLRREEPVGRWLARVARWLHYDLSRTLALDEHGTRFYDAIDGQASLRDIAGTLVATSGRPQAEVEQGVVLFTRTLMTRHLLELRVPRPPSGTS